MKCSSFETFKLSKFTEYCFKFKKFLLHKEPVGNLPSTSFKNVGTNPVVFKQCLLQNNSMLSIIESQSMRKISELIVFD